jgi:hypothetical protein
MKRTAILLAILAFADQSGGSEPLKLSCDVRVPAAYQADPPGWKSPTGEPEALRYTRAYEAFWWNCVLVKADSLDARCPSSCSGTPAATAGCADGGGQAEDAVSRALRAHSRASVQRYLKARASEPDAKRKTEPYFPSGPESTKP